MTSSNSILMTPQAHTARRNNQKRVFVRTSLFVIAGIVVGTIGTALVAHTMWNHAEEIRVRQELDATAVREKGDERRASSNFAWAFCSGLTAGHPGTHCNAIFEATGPGHFHATYRIHDGQVQGLLGGHTVVTTLPAGCSGYNPRHEVPSMSRNDFDTRQIQCAYAVPGMPGYEQRLKLFAQ